MAEEKEPERKKLSLQGNKKLSLGGGQDFIKSNRNNNIPGTRSVQVETRRKRIVRGGLKQNLYFEGNKLKLKDKALNYEEDNLRKVEFTVTDKDGEKQNYTINM